MAAWFTKSVLGLDSEIPRARDWLERQGYLCNYLQSRHLVEDLDYRSVQFTRDPSTRIVSAYLNKFYVYHGKPLSNFDDLEGLARELINFNYKRRHKYAGNYEGISFDNFLATIDEMKRVRRVINYHWDTQLPDYGFVIQPDHIVKQERFADDLKQVNLALDLPQIEQPRRNHMSYPDNFEETDLHLNKMTSIELLKRKLRIKPSNLLDEKNRTFIKSFYAKDFAIFGY